MALGQDDWKQKYKELAQECELLHKHAERSDARIRALSAQLALGLRGKSAALDTEFDQLRELMRGSAPDNRFDQVLGEIEYQIKLLDDQRLSVSQDIRRAFELWLDQLRPLDEQLRLSEQFDDVARQVPDASEHLYRLSVLLLDMVELQKKLLLLPAADDAAAVSSSNDSDASVELSLLERRMADGMLKLIDALNVESEKLAQPLATRLSQGAKAAELPGLMSELINLARQARGLEHQAFGTYLLSLNEQLAHVQAFMAQNKEDEGQAIGQQQQFEEQMRQDVAQLHHSVRETDDLLSIKRIVAQKLSSIVHTMDAYRERESDREQRMRERYEALLAKVGQMQTESEHVRLRLEEEHHRAQTDPLTGLPNRVAYDAQFHAELERWHRYNIPFSIVVADLDRFKQINDRYGHLAGDKVLRLVARILQRNLRSDDFIARYGGEEFVLLLPSTQSGAARVVADKLCAAVAASPFHFHGQPVTVTASFGVAQVTAGDNAESLFARADGALYGAKAGGRNQVFVVEP